MQTTQTQEDFKLRFLRVDFDLPIKFQEISKFRGAIAELVGRESVLFHHHYQDEQGKEKLLYKYPLIQYKRLYGNAAIICLGAAVEEIHKIFEGGNSWKMHMGRREVSLRIHSLRLNEYQLKLLPQEEHYTYTMNKWLGLNSENYQIYQNTEGLRAKVELLESILSGNIISFAIGLGWKIPTQDQGKFSLVIEEFETHVIPFKGERLTAFSVTFKTNLFLPSYIGLGKGVSRGYGMLKFKPNKNTKP